MEAGIHININKIIIFSSIVSSPAMCQLFKISDSLGMRLHMHAHDCTYVTKFLQRFLMWLLNLTSLLWMPVREMLLWFVRRPGSIMNSRLILSSLLMCLLYLELLVGKIYYVLVTVFLLMELSYNTILYSYSRTVDLNGGVCIAGRLKGKGKS